MHHLHEMTLCCGVVIIDDEMGAVITDHPCIICCNTVFPRHFYGFRRRLGSSPTSGSWPIMDSGPKISSNCVLNGILVLIIMCKIRMDRSGSVSMPSDA